MEALTVSCSNGLPVNGIDLEQKNIGILWMILNGHIASIKIARKLHGCFIENIRFFYYALSMKNTHLIKAIKKLIACGLSPSEAFLICNDFIKRFGMHDLDACVRSVEVSHVAKI